MELIPSMIIIFIGFSQFSLLLADKKLPKDNGRFDVAECLGQSLSWVTDEIYGIETYLYLFCQEAEDDIEELFRKKLLVHNLTSDELYCQVRDCLRLRNRAQLINRYKNSKPDDTNDPEELKEPEKLGELEGVQWYPEIFQVAAGLCEAKEQVNFDDLDDDDEKSKSLQCLQNCAVNLFEKFDLLHKALRPTNETQDQTKPSTSVIQQYTDDCKKKDKIDIPFLSETGEKYAKKYIDDINKLYNANPDEDEKEKFFACILSYIGCVKWTCALKSDSDIPFIDVIEDTFGNVHQGDEKLLEK